MGFFDAFYSVVKETVSTNSSVPISKISIEEEKEFIEFFKLHPIIKDKNGRMMYFADDSSGMLLKDLVRSINKYWNGSHIEGRGDHVRDYREKCFTRSELGYLEDLFKNGVMYGNLEPCLDEYGIGLNKRHKLAELGKGRFSPDDAYISAYKGLVPLAIFSSTLDHDLFPGIVYDKNSSIRFKKGSFIKFRGYSQFVYNVAFKNNTGEVLYTPVVKLGVPSRGCSIEIMTSLVEIGDGDIGIMSCDDYEDILRSPSETLTRFINWMPSEDGIIDFIAINGLRYRLEVDRIKRQVLRVSDMAFKTALPVKEFGRLKLSPFEACKNDKLRIRYLEVGGFEYNYVDASSFGKESYNKIILRSMVVDHTETTLGYLCEDESQLGSVVFKPLSELMFLANKGALKDVGIVKECNKRSFLRGVNGFRLSDLPKTKHGAY